MKAVILICAFFASTMASFAGIFIWTAGDFTSEWNGATVYLVQKTSGTATTLDVFNYIKTNGLVAPATNPSGSTYDTFTTTAPGGGISKGTIAYSTTDSAWYTLNNNVVASLQNYTDLFAVVVSADQTKFGVSNEFKSINVTNDATPFSGLDFGVPEDPLKGWDLGDVGGGGAAPEPTVLALIALGVAGLALKRRV